MNDDGDGDDGDDQNEIYYEIYHAADYLLFPDNDEPRFLGLTLLQLKAKR